LGTWFLLPTRALAGPWTPEPGHGYVKLWTKWLPGFGYHDGSGETIDYGAYHELFVSTYGEVGFADGWALFWHSDIVRFFSLTDPRTDRANSHVAPGDPALGLRVRFLRAGRFVMAAAASARAPLADGDPVQEVVATEGAMPVIGELRVGTGEWDFASQISAGYGWDRFYLAGGLGYTVRTGGYDHGLSWSVEGGTSLSDVPLSFRLRIQGLHPIDTGDAPRHNSPSGIGNGTQYTGYALEADWELTQRWWLGLTFEGGLFAIRRQTGGPVLVLYGATKF
jgi:hypothetical protein